MVLDLDLHRGAFELVLVNVGEEAALSVCVALEPALFALGGELDLSELPLFKGLGVLRPGREIRVFVDSAVSLLGREPQCFTAHVTYSDPSGERHERTYTHDVGAFAGIPEIDRS